MQPADANTFRELLRAMNRVLACQSGAELDGPMLDVYWLALREWPLDEFRSACGHLTQTMQFMPKPADFNALRKAQRPSAGEAWAEVRALVRRGEETSGDPLIDAAVRVLGGYRALGMTHRDQMQFLERRFVEHYEAIQDREDIREALPALTGGARLESLYNNPKGLT